MLDTLIPMLYGIPIENIKRDIKDGKYILKSKGNINSNIKAQTVIVYGDVKGNIKADQVVIINGKTTGNIHADTVMGLKDKQKEEKYCNSCKEYSYLLDQCERFNIPLNKKEKICQFYQEKRKRILQNMFLLLICL